MQRESYFDHMQLFTLPTGTLRDTPGRGHLLTCLFEKFVSYATARDPADSGRTPLLSGGFKSTITMKRLYLLHLSGRPTSRHFY